MDVPPPPPPPPNEPQLQSSIPPEANRHIPPTPAKAAIQPDAAGVVSAQPVVAAVVAAVAAAQPAVQPPLNPAIVGRNVYDNYELHDSGRTATCVYCRGVFNLGMTRSTSTLARHLRMCIARHGGGPGGAA